MSKVTASCFVWRPVRGGWTFEQADVELESELRACSEEGLISVVRNALELGDEDIDHLELTDGTYSIQLDMRLQPV